MSVNSSEKPSLSKTGWVQFLMSIATFKGDLSTISAPPFLLAPISSIEFPTSWADQPSLFVSSASGPNAEGRALLVLKWYLSTLLRANIGRKEKLGGKKPLNPFWGEKFLGKFEDDVSGSTSLICEQVSHHPPVTAVYIRNEEHGISLQGYNAQKISLSSSVDIKQMGHMVLHLDKHDEDYVITLPDLHIKGLFSGSPYAEIAGVSHIYSSTGFTTQIDFSGKGWFSGKRNSFKATLYSSKQQKDALYTVTGQWTQELIFKDLRTNSIIETHDCQASTAVELSVKSFEKQDPWESRRAWSAVTAAIKANDMFATGREKSKIETGQRKLRKKEETQATKFEPYFFKVVETDPVVQKLGIQEQLKGHHERTHGIWRVDAVKAKHRDGPFHDHEPTG